MKLRNKKLAFIITGSFNCISCAIEEMEKIQAKYNEIINSDKLDTILEEGASKTREIAKAKFIDMKNKMGLKR